MDSIFEEDADEVGGEIEAYCSSPRCKADTTHTIISMYEDEVRRVQCEVCGEVHAYRKPRGDGTEESADGVAKRSSQRKMSWDDSMSRATDTDLNNCRPFSIRDTYEEGDVVHHSVFDIGFVVELLPDNKVKVVFRDGSTRILVHNRGDLAARMPDISEIPIPREGKKKKRAKKAEPAAQPVQSRSKAEIEAAVLRARAAAHARMDEAQKTVDERTKKLKAEVKKPPAKQPAAAKEAAGKEAATPAKAEAKPAKADAKAAKPAKGEGKPAKAEAKPAKAAKADKAEAKPAKADKAEAKSAKADKAEAKPAKADKTEAKPAKPAKAEAKAAKAAKAEAKPAKAAKPAGKKPAKPASKPAKAAKPAAKKGKKK